MKKIFLFLAVITVCAIAYFNMGPEEKQYMDESDVQAYSNKNLLEDIDIPINKKYMDESDIPINKKIYHAVKNYKPRESTLGYSITPPPGVNWYEKLEDDSLYYLKINKSHRQYSILTKAREVRLSKDLENSKELESYVKNEKEKSLVSSYFKNPNVTVQIEASSPKKCVRYSQSYQDHGIKGLREGHYVNVDTQGLFCLHPDNARVGVDMSYVEKSLSNTMATSYSEEGEKFLTSLTFQRLNR
ncbi:MAG: hypothetical protein KJ630_15680 [Proteobacteria bacterium]|nr:hypothetical protein [Pseudomonadota bacterium]